MLRFFLRTPGLMRRKSRDAGPAACSENGGRRSIWGKYIFRCLLASSVFYRLRGPDAEGAVNAPPVRGGAESWGDSVFQNGIGVCPIRE